MVNEKGKNNADGDVQLIFPINAVLTLFVYRGPKSGEGEMTQTKYLHPVENGPVITAGRRKDDVPMVDLSLVVPVLNEEDSITLFLDRVEPVLQTISQDYEIIFVDDGSTDMTMASIMKRRIENPRIKVLSLSRNFGKDVALSAGLKHTLGKSVVPMDVDLQDPPELIPAMWARKQEGYDVVLAKRSSRQSDSWFKRQTAGMFYRLHNKVADISIPDNTGDFRMLDHKVIDVINRLPERTRFMKGLFAWVGFTHSEIEYERQPRAAGQTKWKYWKLWNFALDGITASSTLPLRIWTYLGVIVALGSFAYAAFMVAKTLIGGPDVPGYPSLMVAVLFLGGVNIMATGILGEYLGRVHVEVRNRPLYVVRETHGIAGDHHE
ncbi:glycosyltransferase family 2 protein [Robiginitomaculum antarcticum]|uniref:glycosyltransferase family 2 protein n=1 Tax=Robiginitomaculum antarcticum TaxID=437507 RepID=UPI00037C206C